MRPVNDLLFGLRRVTQGAAIVVLALIALGLTAATLGASAGLLPWAELSLGFGLAPEIAGMIAQIALTVLAVLLCAVIPSSFRVMRLEVHHRTFALSIEDVGRSYWAAHAADRTGVFRLQSEFDAVRERLAWLRDHPDLGHLEPEVLEIAAKMSFEARELAQVYSEEKVARARTFLDQRMQEAQAMQSRIEEAQTATQQLRRWKETADHEDDIVRARLSQLREELAEVLPALGVELRETGRDTSRDMGRDGGVTPLRVAAE